MLFATPTQPKQQPNVVVLTDEAIRALFARVTVLLKDGPVAVEGIVTAWQRHNKTGLLNAIVTNPLTGTRYVYGPDLASHGRTVREIARLA